MAPSVGVITEHTHHAGNWKGSWVLHVAPHRTGEQTQLPTPGPAQPESTVPRSAPVPGCPAHGPSSSTLPSLAPATPLLPIRPSHGPWSRAGLGGAAGTAPPRVSTWHLKRQHPWTVAEGTHKFCLSDEGRFERRPRRSCVLAPWPLPPWTRPRASGGAVQPPSRAAAGQLLVSHGPFLEGAPSGWQAQPVSPPSSSSERVRRGQPGRRDCPGGEEARCADMGGSTIGPGGPQVLQPHWPDRTDVDAF